VAAVASGCSRGGKRPHAAEVARVLAERPAWVGGDAFGRSLWDVERRFYAARGRELAWFEDGDATPRADELLKAAGAAERHGLDPASYRIGELEEACKSAKGERIAELDARLTYAFLSYAADLVGARTSPRSVDPLWLPAPSKLDLAQTLRRALDAGKVAAALQALAPAHPQYRALAEALARARKGGRTGEAERIALNLERWRWAPRELGARYILVNVPAYAVRVYEGDRPVLAMRAIVGKPDSPTPLFSDRMTTVVFSPYWNIPEKIRREETLPHLAKDPYYLARNNIEVVTEKGEVLDASALDWSDAAATASVRFRQAPGDDNALGLVKFLFPNDFDVYLHDTPNAELFAREHRALSHGCVRVEKPVELAEYLLADRREWPPERIAEAMHAKVEKQVPLKHQLPVHIVYLTAWVEEDGRLTLTDDPYGLDARQAALRRGEPLPPRRPAAAAPAVRIARASARR
jgi:murein L,D-transpeptidase YcbB/YkuD